MASCLKCYGVGWRDGVPCPECGGTGTVPDPKIPPADPSLDIEPSTKARASDPWTAHNAADAIAKMGRAKNQRWQLLQVFASSLGEEGLTSEEAATLAPGVSIRSEYSTRCSELQRLGMLRPTGGTRKGEAGVERDVYIITERGWKAMG